MIVIPTILSRNIRPRRRRLDVGDYAPSPGDCGTPTGVRERITPASLLRAINQELQTRPECAGMRVHGAGWADDELAGDCNWAETCLIVRVSGSVGHEGFSTLRRVIARARLRYDVYVPEAYLM